MRPAPGSIKGPSVVSYKWGFVFRINPPHQAELLPRPLPSDLMASTLHIDGMENAGRVVRLSQCFKQQFAYRAITFVHVVQSCICFDPGLLESVDVFACIHKKHLLNLSCHLREELYITLFDVEFSAQLSPPFSSVLDNFFVNRYRNLFQGHLFCLSHKKSYEVLQSVKPFLYLSL